MRRASSATGSTDSQRSHSRKKSIPGDPHVKKFACGYAGCGRSFTRSEHLQRHLLNHTEGESTCERCRAHFKRKDLLERHMQRHRQKDEEAGGEGHGILNTRKRMWKDVDGKIVTKRPNLGTSSQQGSPEIRQESPNAAASIEDDAREFGIEIPISPPISSTNSNPSETYERRASHATTATELASDDWVFPPLALSPGHESPELYQDTETLPQETERFWGSSEGISSTTGISKPFDDVPYDDIFNPDTASSFNMPFTTMSNYNWLFDLDLATQQSLSTPPDLFAPTHVHQAPESQASTHTLEIGLNRRHTPAVSDLATSTDGRAMNATNQSHYAMIPELSMETGISLPQLAPQRTLADTSPPLSNTTRNSVVNSGETLGACKSSRKSLAANQSFPDMDFERPMSTLNRSAMLPVIDEATKNKIVDLIDAAKPITPDGFYISRTHPLLTLSSLQTYSNMYFTRFNTAYPLIHQPTFEPASVEPLLLVSVLLLGATYGSKDAHQMAVCIHDVLRPQIFAHPGFNAKPDLWALQTILLVECFGKSRAGQKQHDMAHLFHGLLINLIRRSDCQTVSSSIADPSSNNLDAVWRNWTIAEQKRRLAYLCFMWDVQHAVLFCQSLCMSAFELRSNLPCHQQIWEASSAETWYRLWKKHSRPPLFLTTLKTYLVTPKPVSAPKHLNALSRVLMLHGLMSISWDMKRRDQTSLGLVDNTPLGDWKARISASYDAWLADFEAYCASYTARYCQNKHTRAPSSIQQSLQHEFRLFATANIAIYHAASFHLNAEFLDIQIYAGARHILGRPVQRADFVRSQRVVKKWAAGAADYANPSSTSRNLDVTDSVKVAHSSSNAAKAAWHAAALIRDGATRLRDWDAGGLFHYPWCLYLACLCIWAYWHAKPRDEAPPVQPTLGAAASRRDSLHASGAASWEKDNASSSSSLSTRRRLRQRSPSLPSHNHPADPDTESFDGHCQHGSDEELLDYDDEIDEDAPIWNPDSEMHALLRGMMARAPPSSAWPPKPAAAAANINNNNNTTTATSSSTATPSSSSLSSSSTTTAQPASSHPDQATTSTSSASAFALPRIRNIKRKTAGLTAVVAHALSRVRWAVVHDGMMVLRGLVPGRVVVGSLGGGAGPTPITAATTMAVGDVGMGPGAGASASASASAGRRGGAGRRESHAANANAAAAAAATMGLATAGLGSAGAGGAYGGDVSAAVADDDAGGVLGLGVDVGVGMNLGMSLGVEMDLGGV
ncbi:fungal-specific transcription factor domain-containing protein [Phyllosticta capitalensis]